MPRRRTRVPRLRRGVREDRAEGTIWEEAVDSRESRTAILGVLARRNPDRGWVTMRDRFWGFVSDVSENIEDLHARLAEVG